MEIRCRRPRNIRVISAIFILIFWVSTSWASNLSDTPAATANETSPGQPGDIRPDSVPAALPYAPIYSPNNVETPRKNENSVDWNGLASDAWRFLAIMQAYRVATEPGTRAGLKGPFFDNYASAIENLHGWADGDEFLVNYVGHPMEGAVSGYIWVHNDRQYRLAEFGRDRYYWKSRLRAAAYAWAYSEQFEIGLVSEASIGAIQKYPPQQGFVDHVITPTIGMAWMIAEDSIDQYLIKRIEARTSNRMVRRLVRAGLNPSRSFANLMEGSYPWHRDTRPGVGRYDPKAEAWLVSAGFLKSAAKPPVLEVPDAPGPAPFEFSITFRPERLSGGGTSTPCVGGGGTAAFRVSQSWQLIADVGGCKMIGLGTNLSGDSLTYMLGPRRVIHSTGSLSGYVQVLVGGNKLTEELMFPAKKNLLTQLAKDNGTEPPTHDKYTEQTDTNGFALSLGGGVQYKLNRALAIRVAEISYRRSWVSPLWGRDFSNGFQLTTGLVVRMGTW